MLKCRKAREKPLVLNFEGVEEWCVWFEKGGEEKKALAGNFDLAPRPGAGQIRAAAAAAAAAAPARSKTQSPIPNPHLF